MLITEILARNARMYGAETALIEREPAKNRRVEITWKEFDDCSNRIARALIDRGIRKGDKVVQLMTNCIEWLPIYFGILRTGAWVVPLNFRFDAATILQCVETAEARAFIFGPEFIERVETIKAKMDPFLDTYWFVGDESIRPAHAEPYPEVIASFAPEDPAIIIKPMRPGFISHPGQRAHPRQRC
ncbi:MAG: class I adenylate-forming enzyme family protein [Deltaproteobacteria bacterium]|nr:class I adenylate-forming enzyme family protein [Deltaproteobacteria bacterium]